MEQAQVRALREVEGVRIVAFDRGKNYCWSMFPAMLTRIGEFARKYCRDQVPEALVEHITQDFAAPKQNFFILGAVDKDFELHGHLVACISIPAWSATRRCLVLQYEVDDDADLPLGLRQAAFEMVVGWAQKNGCESIIAETKTEQAARAYRMFHGFANDLNQVKRML